MQFPPSPSDESGRGPAPPSGLDRLAWGLARVAAALGAGVVVLMMAVVIYSVINRYILGTPVTWTDEFSGYLVVALVMLGAAEALRRGDHISVDLITARFGPGHRRLVDAWGNLLVLAVAVSLLISGTATIRYSVDFDIFSEGYLEVPMWIPQSFLMLGAGLLALVALANLLRLLRRDRVS
jgi:TRAP-type C4-dicarboxylate transport system permease small subunit